MWRIRTRRVRMRWRNCGEILKRTKKEEEQEGEEKEVEKEEVENEDERRRKTSQR